LPHALEARIKQILVKNEETERALPKRRGRKRKSELSFGVQDCVSALANYLIYVSKAVNARYYQTVVKTMLLFHDFIIKFNVSDSDEEGNDGVNGAPSISNSDFIPDYCNEFIINYCTPRLSHPLVPSRKDLVKIIEHLCSWLFQTKQTSTKLLRHKD